MAAVARVEAPAYWRSLFAAHPRLRARSTHFGNWDFTSLYKELRHSTIVQNIEKLLGAIFDLHRDPVSGLPMVMRVPLLRDESVTWVPHHEKGRNTPKVRFFDQRDIMHLLVFILNSCYVTVGDKLFRQVSGIPMGYTSAPMIAIFTLSSREIFAIRSLVADVGLPDGTLVSSPWGSAPLAEPLRNQLRRFISNLARSCRNIDDVFFVNLTQEEQSYAINRLYDPVNTLLEAKLECCSPGRIEILDMEVVVSRHGIRTILFDKREKMAAAGTMGSVQRFPHFDSFMATQAKYGTLTGFAHRAHDAIMLRGNFVSEMVKITMQMVANGYSLKTLRRLLDSFMAHAFQPPTRRKLVRAQIVAGIAAALRSRPSQSPPLPMPPPPPIPQPPST